MPKVYVFTVEMTFTFIFTNNSIIIPNSLIPLNGANTTGWLNITVVHQNLNLHLNMQFTQRDCLPGEHKNPFSEFCELCTYGFYSLNIEDSCMICPSQNMTCFGGNIRTTHEKNWMEETMIKPLPCVDDGVKRCQGGFLDKQCYTGYSGVLYHGCDYSKKFALTSGNRCEPCSDETVIMLLKYACQFLGSFLLELYFYYVLIR